VIVSKVKKKPLTFSPDKWVSLQAALRRIMSITELRDRALHYLNRDLRSGRLRSELEEISPDGKEMHTLLKPSYWQQRTVKAAIINPEEGVWVEPYVAGRCLVLRADLDKCYPTTAAHQSDDTEEKQKPGIKPLKDWPNRFLAPEMVRVAYETPNLLQDRPELVKHVRKFLKDEIRWEPYDNKPINRELDRLLSRIK
jgi:hypothetical protein